METESDKAYRRICRIIDLYFDLPTVGPSGDHDRELQRRDELTIRFAEWFDNGHNTDLKDRALREKFDEICEMTQPQYEETRERSASHEPPNPNKKGYKPNVN